MRPLSRLHPAIAAFLTAAVVLAGAFQLENIERDRLVQRSRTETLDQLSIVRGRIESALNARIFLNRGLAAYVSIHPQITASEFQTLAPALLGSQTGIRSIQLAKDSVVSHIYPMVRNEAALGLKLLEHPKQRNAVLHAIDSRQTIVAGPVELVQGGTAFIGRTPIFLASPDGEPGSGSYWGLSTIILDKDSLFEEAGLNQMPPGFDFALRGKDGTGASGAAFWGDSGLFDRNAMVLDVTLPNGTWQIAAMPKGGWTAPRIQWLRLGGILLALVAGALAWFLVRNPARLRELVQQTTHALKESEEKYRALIQNANSILIHLDGNANITFINEYAQKFFGWDDSELIGQPALGTFVPETESTGRSLANMMADMLKRPEDYTQVETENRCKDGKRVWVSWNNRFFYDPQGKLSGVLCVGTDVSERRRFESALKVSENHYRSMLESAAGFVIYRLQMEASAPLGAKLSLISPSALEVLGIEDPYQLEEYFQYIHPEDLERIREKHLNSITEPRIYSEQLRWFHSRKQCWIWLSIMSTPVFDAEGRLTHRNGLVLDITQQKEAEDLLKVAHDEMENVIGKRTHELRIANQQLSLEIREREVAEATLREQRDLYHALIQAQSEIGEGVFIIENGRFTFANEALSAYFGYTHAEIMALPSFLTLIHPDDRERVLLNHQRRLNGENFENCYEIGILTRERTRQEAEIAVARIPGDGPMRIAVVVRDITQRKLTDTSLRNQLLFTQALFESIPNPIFFKNREGKYQGCNRAFEEAFGISRDEIKGKTVHEIMPGEFADIYSEMDQAMFEKPGYQIYESQAGYADGKTRNVIISKASFMDASGELGGLVGVMLDITERKQMEESLRRAHEDLEARIRERTRELARANEELSAEIQERKQAEEQLRRQAQIIDQTHDAVITTDSDGIITFWNNGARQIFGYSAEEALGRHISFMDIQPQQQDERRQALAQLFEQGFYEMEPVRRTKSGELVHIHLILTLLKDLENRTIGIVGYAMDISERKHLEQQIIGVSEEEQKRIGQELHDGLGQHLTGIAFLGKVLEQKLAAQSLPEVQDATEIVQFVNQAISKTRLLARGLFPVELEANGLMSALEQLATTASRLYGITCAFHCEKPVLVNNRIIAINLYRIAQEALNNAAKHSKASSIRIELTSSGDKTRLSIIDNGIGFNQKQPGAQEGMGFHIMRYRAGMIGSMLNIQEATGGGTEVQVSLNQ